HPTRCAGHLLPQGEKEDVSGVDASKEPTMTDQPTEADLNALDITDAEAAEMNAIAHPLLADAAPDANDDLVQIDALPSGVVFVTINRPEKKNAFDAATIAALYEAFETLQGADRVRVVF